MAPDDPTKGTQAALRGGLAVHDGAEFGVRADIPRATLLRIGLR